jgi:poly-gamma-glutamate capsule biosynthesis protein CapA/YwtB (metallophosphatase superfamily)
MFTFKDGKEVFRESTGDDTLELLIAGDCCPRNECEELIIGGKSASIISDIKPVLDDCDLSMVQFETPLSNNGEAIYKDGPNIIVAPECVDFIKECGFDIAALANNHIGDYGPIPVMDTIDVLDNNGIKHMGAGKDLESSRKPLFVEKNGLTLAFLNYAENEFGGATKTMPGASTLDPCVNISQIREVSQQADITLVIVHGGNEFNPVPSPRMKKTYRAFVEAGASAVINIHAHCPQGIELWNGAPIVYCPGNFYFDSNFDFCTKTMWTVGYMVKLNLDKQGAFALSVHPYNIEFDGSKINLFAGEKKAKFNAYLAEISAIINDEDKTQKMFNAWVAMRGKKFLQHYAPFIDLSSFDKDPKELPTSPAARNMLTCEAHNEIFTTLMRLYLDEQLDEAKKLIPEVERLGNPYTQGFLQK